MLTSQMIKEAALAAGADACGIGSMDRFAEAPKDMDPRYLFPEAKSVVGFVFRIPRGVQRGIEEGTQFYQYPFGPKRRAPSTSKPKTKPLTTARCSIRARYVRTASRPIFSSISVWRLSSAVWAKSAGQKCC